MHSRVGVLPVHERYGYPVVSSARAQGTRFVDKTGALLARHPVRPLDV